MAIKRKSRAFKDISLSFKPHPITGDMPVLVNERAIVRSVRNLVETIPTERFFEPLIGTDIRGMLFENYTKLTSYVIEDQIKISINNYEPRVANVKTDVIGRPDRNSFEVTVFFDIVGLDRPRQNFTFLLEPTR
jgi:hypothetical protein|tara:strand:+ start:384 stop:785 length:402 start_codon:yes stop_codon:yes gene_type:complete